MRKPAVAFIGALCVALATTTHAGPSVYSNHAKATDLGSVHSFEADGPVTLTIAMKLTHTDELESLLNSVYTKGDLDYRHFLTTKEFNARFGPSTRSRLRLPRILRRIAFELPRQRLKFPQQSPAMSKPSWASIIAHA
jgi:hypothetical protein